jgi:hypothetical protein
LLTGSSIETAIGDVIDDVPGTTNFPPAGIRATPSGLAVVGVGLLDNLQANRVLLTYLAVLFVFLFLAVRLRSVIRSLLSLLPVLIAVGVASLVAYGLSLKLSPMTAVGGPLVVAACTEFTSLILLRFVEERRRGMDPREAIDVAAARTGRAFVVSALTAIVGVAVLSFSSLPLLRDFGRIVAMNVFVALLSALVIGSSSLRNRSSPLRPQVDRSRCRDERREAGCERDSLHEPEPRPLEQARQLVGGAFASRSKHTHQQMARVGEVTARPAAKLGLHHDELRLWAHRPPDARHQLDGAVVVPVVDDRQAEIAVAAGGDAFEEAAAHDCAPFREVTVTEAVGGAGYHVGKIE